MTYEREQITTILDRLNEKPRFINIIVGPRQSGKTTLIRQVLDRIGLESRYLAVDEPDTQRLPSTPSLSGDSTIYSMSHPSHAKRNRDQHWLVRQWEIARFEAAKHENGFVLVFDEIQKIPNWSETVKGLWDSDRGSNRNLHVVLLGSSPLLVWKGMNESLVGRFEVIRLKHWSFYEMSVAFDFDMSQYIYFGGYPGSAPLITDEARWRSYIQDAIVEPSVSHDVLAMHRVDKPALLRRLFELSSEYSGQILSYNKLLGQLQDAGNTTTLAHYLDLLDSADLIIGLQNFSPSGYRQKRSSPKLNVLNSALMGFHSGYSFEEAKADRTYWGRLVESVVGAHLLNTRDISEYVYYWRHQNSEVDFVLRRGRKLIGIEVKSGARTSKMNGLEIFERNFDVKHSFVVGTGGIPISEFLSIPANDWFE